VSYIKGLERGARVLVTGAAGFIGSHLVERLLGLGYEVVGLDAFTGNYSRGLKLANLGRARDYDGFRLVEGDLLSLDTARLLRDVHGVAHLAGEPGVRASWGDDFRRYLERNVWATQRLLEAVPGSPVRRFVYASSSSVYGADRGGPVEEEAPRRPASPYGLSKLAAEEAVGLYRRERGVPATVLRYFTVYGPRQRPEMALCRFISAALRGERVEVYGDGEQIRELTHVGDVVDATVAALETPWVGTYNIGGGARATVNELLDAVGRALGLRVEALYEPPASGDVRSTWADSGRAARELGYLPRVGLEEGIGTQVEWMMQEIRAPSRV
jgi:UDP-glucuronate 4-epimerase